MSSPIPGSTSLAGERSSTTAYVVVIEEDTQTGKRVGNQRQHDQTRPDPNQPSHG